jgi:hypothetical protein
VLDFGEEFESREILWAIYHRPKRAIDGPAPEQIVRFCPILILQCSLHVVRQNPDESTAVRIAEAVFTPIYGRSLVRAEHPFHARLEGNHWIVNGTLHKPRKSGLIVMGGTMTAEIDKATGRILDVYHAK